jgi:hypothetical protein
MAVVLVALNIVLGLGLEALGASRQWSWSEPLVDAMTLLHLGLRLWRPPAAGAAPLPRQMLLSCLALATAGELVLSLGLGLYRYRRGGLPLFVPAGHVLLFLAGVRLEASAVARVLPRLVLALAVPLLLWELMAGRDALSVPLLVLFALCLRFGPSPRLYAVMFLLALGLELLGTGLSAWRWTPELPGGFHSANPPLAAGVFYAVLDLLTLAITRRLVRPQPLAARATAAT